MGASLTLAEAEVDTVVAALKLQKRQLVNNTNPSPFTVRGMCFVN